MPNYINLLIIVFTVITKTFVEIEMFLKSNLKQRQYDKIKELKNIEKYPFIKILINSAMISIQSTIFIKILLYKLCKEIYNENEINIKEDMKQLNRHKYRQLYYQ